MSVWVFMGDGAAFPAAIFTTRSAAEQWIARHGLDGVLTAYPLDISAFDWAVSNGYFEPKRGIDGRFIGRFSSAYQEHYHYENGTTSHSD